MRCHVAAASTRSGGRAVIHAYLVDDESLAIDRLKRLLEKTGRVEVVGSATQPRAALEFLRVEKIDVLFLDICMPGLTGFELLSKLTSPPSVVLTTAHDQFALKALEVNSID
jgi:two-component system LytT family response regulator